MFRKLLYFGSNLMGIGDGKTQRQAKIASAEDALINLKEGRVLQKPYSKDGKYKVTFI